MNELLGFMGFAFFVEVSSRWEHVHDEYALLRVFIVAQCLVGLDLIIQRGGCISVNLRNLVVFVDNI